jgi:cytochrome b
MQTIRVWDLPTRLFHWGMVLCVVGLVISANIEAGDALLWHSRFGYCLLTLLLFRVLWGLVGGHWSLFSSFIYSPVSVLNYLRGKAKAEHLVGHNPMGALSVFALMTALLLQISAGLVSDNEIDFTGPLNHLVSNATALAATTYHKTGGKALIILLVLLHLGAIAFYRFKKKERLVQAMITGDKHLPDSGLATSSNGAQVLPQSKDSPAQRALALVLLVICAALVYALVRGK